MNSKNLIDFLKKNQVAILSILVFFFFIRSCGNARDAKKLERSNKILVERIDSLNLVVQSKNLEIYQFPETLRLKSLSIHQEYDLWISKRDRSPQLMELHTTYVKPKIQEYSK